MSSLLMVYQLPLKGMTIFRHFLYEMKLVILEERATQVVNLILVLASQSCKRSIPTCG